MTWYVEEQFKVVLGGNTFINTPNLIVYKDKPLFRIERRESDGQLGIDFDIFDEEGQRAATVRRSNIVQGDEDKYAIIRAADHYVLTHKASSRVICDIRKKGQARNAELEVSVDMYTPSGFHLVATPTQTNIATHVLIGNVFENCAAGITVT